MSAFGIRAAVSSILSGCSGNVSVAVCESQNRSQELWRLDHGPAAAAATGAAGAAGAAAACIVDSTAATIVVALDATNTSRGISGCAIKWASSNVLQPGDCLTILAIHSKHPQQQQQQQAGRRMWAFPKLAGECAMDQCTNRAAVKEDLEAAIKETCTRLALKLCDSRKVHVKVKLITEKNMVAVEASRARASWAVLDRNLKKEANICVQAAACNVVVVNLQGGFRILCLKNFRDHSNSGLLPVQEDDSQDELQLAAAEPAGQQKQKQKQQQQQCKRRRPVTNGHLESNLSSSNISSSSPEIDTPFTATERGSTSSSLSSSASSSSYEQHDACNSNRAPRQHCSSFSFPDSLGNATTKTSTTTTSRLDEQLLSETKSILSDAESFIRQVTSSISPQDITDRFSALQLEFHHDRKRLKNDRTRHSHLSSENNSPGLVTIDESSSTASTTTAGLPPKRDRFGDHLSRTSRVRKAVSLPLIKRSVAGSPPLCSICQHASPDFGRPPKRFTFAELEFATGSFCKANFLAEGGYGSVHRGVLADGIPVAVKQYKLASSQGDLEFCSEVEVLSCAQHRNVVMLIGYCIEQNKRLLVYEFICNGSLDSHLYGQNRNSVLKWSARHKVATGAARGLRYLHEECRVGCIVHRDLRPNNILLTHDFEPMVGDFGLARWQPDGDLGVETRVIGTFGYLAPEYTQTGHITEKADVYSFGVVLLELVTGRKAIDISRPRGQQCLTEWARPLLEEQAHYEMVDPLLQDDYHQYEAFCMLYTASLCTQRDPQRRPKMSQVLRMLEGDLNISRNSSPMRSGSNSGRLIYSPRSNSARMSPTARASKQLFSPSDDSLDQAVTSYMSAHPIIGCDTKLSHQTLKAGLQAATHELERTLSKGSGF